MRLGRQTIWVSGLAVGLMVVGYARTGHASGPGPAAQQNIPNAPTPQTLPQLNTITPVGPNMPPGATSSASADTSNGGAAAPGSTLPATAPTAAQATQEQDQGPPPVAHESEIHVFSNLVQIPFTVKDSKNRQVPGLTWRDVRVYENGVRVPRLAQFTTDPYPLSVALVLDQSVTFDTMRKINDSLSALQGAFTPYDEVAVFTYANGVVKQTGFTAAQSARLGVILERSKSEGEEPMMGLTGPLAHGPVINNAPIDGVNTVGQVQGSLQINPPKQIHTLLDAIFAAAQETAQAGRDRRRIVYVVSDGKESGSQIRERDLIKYLQTNKIEVWATLVGDTSIPGVGFLDRIHLPLTMRDDVLPRITAATGGQTDPEFRPRGIQNSFAKITEEVRTQYTLGYYTHISPFNEKFRSIDVRVLRPGLTVIAEPGYYPSASDSRPSTANPPVARPRQTGAPAGATATPPATE